MLVVDTLFSVSEVARRQSRPVQGNSPHEPAGWPGTFFTSLKERLRRSLARHSVTAASNNTGAPSMRFLRHDEIYRSDVVRTTSRAWVGGPPPADRPRAQARGRGWRTAPFSSSSMSSDRLFLDRVARQHCPSPLHRHDQDNSIAGSKETNYHRTVNSVLTVCLTSGGKRRYSQ